MLQAAFPNSRPKSKLARQSSTGKGQGKGRAAAEQGRLERSKTIDQVRAAAAACGMPDARPRPDSGAVGVYYYY
jgi:hypothetical protein